MTTHSAAEITRKITRFLEAWSVKAPTVDAFNEFFNAFLAKENITAAELLSHGGTMLYSQVLIKYGAESMRWFKRAGLLTEDMIIDALSILCHYELFDEALIAFKENPVEDQHALQLALAHYPTQAVFIGHVRFLRKIGILDLSNVHSFMTECLTRFVAKRDDVDSAKMLVEMGLPASAYRSLLLRMTSMSSSDIKDIQFFVSQGAKVEDSCYESVFLALSYSYYRHVEFLLKVSGLTIDEMKAMLASHFGNEGGWQEDHWGTYEKYSAHWSATAKEPELST